MYKSSGGSVVAYSGTYLDFCSGGGHGGTAREDDPGMTFMFNVDPSELLCTIQDFLGYLVVAMECWFKRVVMKRRMRPVLKRAGSKIKSIVMSPLVKLAKTINTKLTAEELMEKAERVLAEQEAKLKGCYVRDGRG